jgi:hypothetical protein
MEVKIHFAIGMRYDSDEDARQWSLLSEIRERKNGMLVSLHR